MISGSGSVADTSWPKQSSEPFAHPAYTRPATLLIRDAQVPENTAAMRVPKAGFESAALACGDG